MSTSLAAEIANVLNGMDLEHLREIGFKTKIKVQKKNKASTCAVELF